MQFKQSHQFRQQRLHFQNFTAILLPTMLLLLLVLTSMLATVASVPTSVLAQNSELKAAIGAAKTNMLQNTNNNGNKQQQYNNNNSNSNSQQRTNNYMNNMMNNMQQQQQQQQQQQEQQQLQLQQLHQNQRMNLNNNNNGNNNNGMPKVKRSFNILKDSMPNAVPATNGGSSSQNVGVAAAKKSSPEIVPATFNAPASSSQPFSSVSSNNSPNGMGGGSGNGATAAILLPSSNGDFINSAIAAGLTAAAVEAAAAANQRELEQQQQQQLQQQAQLYVDDLYDSRADAESAGPSNLLHKRGINSQQYLYGGGGNLGTGYSTGNYGGGGPNYMGNSDYYNNPYMSAAGGAAAAIPASSANVGGLSNVPNGIWADELDPATVVYTDLQDLDDYAPATRVSSYRNKAYDNLQNLLNAEAYLEPVVLPLQYTNRYYGAADADRNKRSNLNVYNNNKYAADMRIKRDTKLTPADMLALVALVEAGERARKDTDTDTGYMYPAAETAYNNPKNYNYNPNIYDYPTSMDDADYGGAWLEPAVVDYYGVPVNMETMPKYEIQREHKHGAGANAAGNRYNTKRFMVAKKKRSMGKFLNEPISKPSISYGNGEKYY